MHFTICDHLLDLVENSIQAGSQSVQVLVCQTGASLLLEVADDGPGMDPAAAARAVDPFHSDGVKHPGRSVGLGLPFLKQLAEQTNGRFRLETGANAGTTVRLELATDNVNIPPVGDLPVALQQALCYGGDYEMDIVREIDGVRYAVKRSDLVDALDGLDTAGAQKLLQEYLKSQESEIAREARNGKDDA